MYENDMRPLDQTVTFLTCVDARMLWFEKVLSFQLPSIFCCDDSADSYG